MLNPNDLFTYQETVPMKDPNSGTLFGTSIIQYSIERYIDTQNLGNTLAYVLSCKHRIIIPNATPYRPGPNSNAQYDNYPAIMTNSIGLSVANTGAQITLRKIFPQTLNSSVSTSQSQESSSGMTNSVQNSSGSNTSQTNTFGVNVSGGVFAGLPVVNIGAEYSHGWESGSFSSLSTGSDRSNHRGSSNSESMSIKDWSSYGYIDTNDQTPSWIWGQSYPWDVIQYNYSSDGVTILLPPFVQSRMSDGTEIFPPSQLSLFGIDFTMTASWLIAFPEGVTSMEEVILNHAMSYYTASHELSSGALVTRLQSSNQASTATYESPALPLSTYSLLPLLSADSRNGAAIGFTVNPFTYPPSVTSSQFKIVSAANNLQVSGTGFTNLMEADFSNPVSLLVNFKILDTTNDYSLLLMNWIGEQSGACKLLITINKTHAVTLYVDAAEGQGGQNNVTSIDLRNTDFTSINFHDYLTLGLNQIQIQVEPIDDKAENLYTLFAMAIGQA
ncbi:hypothetical protein [Kluyvera intermedia]|uniref:hypothetical protein n=1 Tax=Kluyvera intermedia TaxID=61648 RepID=UPI0035236777